MKVLMLEDDYDKVCFAMKGHPDIFNKAWVAYFREALPAQWLTQKLPGEEWIFFIDNEVVGPTSGFDFLKWAITFDIKVSKVFIMTHSPTAAGLMAKLCEENNIPWEKSCVIF